MIRKLVPVVFLLFCAALFAQEDSQKNSSVELPSFVITGKDVISLPKLKKMQSGFVSTVSEEFFKPAFTQDDFEISKIPDPGKKAFNSLDSVAFVSGNIEAGLGVNDRPFTKGHISKQFNGGIFGIEFQGFNKRAYVENADRYFLAGGVGFTFFINDNSPILSNAKIDVGAKYSFDSYKLFASPDPEEKRKLERGNFYFNIKNPTSKIFAYDFGFFNTIDRISDEKFFENVIGVNGYSKIQVGDISLNGKLIALNQRLSNNDFSNRDFKIIDVRPYAGFNITRTFKMQAGFDFFKSDSSSKGNVYGAITIPFGTGVSLYGEYAPQQAFLSYYDLSKNNRYLNTVLLNNVVIEKKNLINILFKYEYERYYEINGGFEYYSSDKHPYLIDEKAGQFNTGYLGAKSSKLYVNFLFHGGPLGYFYGNVSYNELKMDNGNQLPYVPKVSADLVYGYEIGYGFEYEAKLKYNGLNYADAENSVELKNYIDLSLRGIYNFDSTFNFFGELNNILNNKNYYWKGYKEDTFNLSLGINYKF